jgi:cephalosporin hydroxylase
MRVKNKMPIIFMVWDEMETIKHKPTTKEKLEVYKTANKILSDFLENDTSEDENLIKVQKLINNPKPAVNHFLNELPKLVFSLLKKAMKPLL